jgi:microsomal dipeptidase-like Zn-dependent dipeptidase
MKRLGGQRYFDDPRYDSLLPHHPLSQIRAMLGALLAPGVVQVIDPAPSRPAGELVLPEVGGVMVPPPRYARMSALGEKFVVFSRVSFSGTDGVQRAQRERRAGLIYGFQDSSPIGENPDRIAVFQRLGVRVIQLTRSKRNLIGDSCMESANAGLSQYGQEVIEQLNAEKILVDATHGGQRTIREAIAASKAPIISSHTGCRALSDLPRNTADAELPAMAERGGVAGILFWPYLREQGQPMATDLIRHIEHAIKICGEDHVGIGSDNTVSPVQLTPQFEKDNREFIETLIKDGIFTKGRSPTSIPSSPASTMRAGSRRWRGCCPRAATPTRASPRSSEATSRA